MAPADGCGACRARLGLCRRNVPVRKWCPYLGGPRVLADRHLHRADRPRRDPRPGSAARSGSAPPSSRASYTALIFCRSVVEPPRTHLATGPILIGLRSSFARPRRASSLQTRPILEALDRPIRCDSPKRRHWRACSITSSAHIIPVVPRHPNLRQPRRTPTGRTLDQLGRARLPRRGPAEGDATAQLKQLGLVYEVRHGYLRITSRGRGPIGGPRRSRPDRRALLASLLAAGFGAVARPIVAEPRRKQPGLAASEPSLPPEGQAGRSAGVKSAEND